MVTSRRLTFRRLTLRLALAAIILVLVQGVVLADSRISFRLQGNWTYVSGGDVNPGTQNWFYYNKESWPYWHGGYRAVHNGYEFGGDVIIALTPRIGISIGGGYLRISRASSMLFGTLVPSIRAAHAGANPRLSAVPIRVGMHLTMPLSRKVNFLTEGGGCYYFNARYSDELEAGTVLIDMGLISSTHITTSAKAKGVPLGLHGGLGFEYRLLPNFFLSLSALGRYARFRTWEGSSEFEIFDAVEGTTTFSEQGLLYYELVPDLPDPPRLITVQSLSSMMPEPRKTVIDFSSVSLQLGIRIRL